MVINYPTVENHSYQDLKNMSKLGYSSVLGTMQTKVVTLIEALENWLREKKL